MLQPTYAGIRQKLGQLQFPQGESPHVSKMSIYCGNSLSECSAPSLPLPRYPTLYQDGLEIIRRQRQTLGIRIRLVSVPNLDDSDHSPTGSGRGGSSSVENVGGERACLDYPTPREIYFGDSVQDVISAVGAPARIFYKAEDKMKIHSPNAHKKAATQKSDYFYNYFTLGFVSLTDHPPKDSSLEFT